MDELFFECLPINKHAWLWRYQFYFYPSRIESDIIVSSSFKKAPEDLKKEIRKQAEKQAVDFIRQFGSERDFE